MKFYFKASFQHSVVEAHTRPINLINAMTLVSPKLIHSYKMSLKLSKIVTSPNSGETWVTNKISQTLELGKAKLPNS